MVLSTDLLAKNQARSAGTNCPSAERTTMKTYTVFYYIKSSGFETLCARTNIEARSAKEAKQICKQQVREEIGRNAFRPFIKIPDQEEIDFYKSDLGAPVARARMHETAYWALARVGVNVDGVCFVEGKF